MKQFLIFMFVLALVVSCNKNSDLVESISTENVVLYTSKLLNGNNGGLTTESKDISLTKIGEDSLFLSQSPLVEYLYDIAIDSEEIFTYEIDTISNDTISVSSVINEISRDTLSITAGPIWLPFDSSNEVSLKVGLKKEFLTPELSLMIDVRVTDDIPSSSGLLFISLKNDDETLAIIPPPVIDTTKYIISDVIPKYNPNGKITNYTDGIIIPRFTVRQFFINDTTLTRDFEIIITTSDGSVVVAPFSIKFVDLNTYNQRQCWLSGFPECQDLFIN